MSPRASRVVFGLLVVIFGTAIVFALLWSPAPPITPRWIGALCEIGVLIAGAAIAFTAPPAAYRPSVAIAVSDPSAPAPASVYRGAQAPPSRAPTIPRASARRLTIGILAALGFTAATVPFAFHLPRWVEAELVVAAWWTIWSIVLAVIAYRGAKVADDHRPGSGRVVELTSKGTSKWSSKWSWIFEGASDPEGCALALLILAVVGVALLGAWLVVELVAPAVFIVAYRGVVRALAKAHAANTRGNVVRSTLSGMGWAALGTAPLAVLVAIVHTLFTA